MILSLLVLAIIVLASYPAMADTYCKVTDPTGTPLNVRETPNGKISALVSKLENNTLVDLIETKKDSKGRLWAYVAGAYLDGYMDYGWVFKKYLTCYDRQEFVEGYYTHCDVVDPTGTPLNVRLKPAGKIVSTLPNGTTVDIIREEKDDMNNTWVEVGIYKDGFFKVLGWVYKNYLKCYQY